DFTRAVPLTATAPIRSSPWVAARQSSCQGYLARRRRSRNVEAPTRPRTSVSGSGVGTGPVKLKLRALTRTGGRAGAPSVVPLNGSEAPDITPAAMAAP